jgi:ParB-like chromosome segregation protein Spo0J
VSPLPKKSARTQDILPYHPLANIFPTMVGAEFDELVADLKTRGQIEPIITYDGMILDGRNRYRACLKNKIEPVLKAGDDWIDDPAAYVRSANIHRRHLKAKEKRDLIAELLKANPEKPNRQIAKEVGVSHTHLAKVRTEMEKAGDVETVATSIDTKGRKQPAKKKRPTVEDFKRDIAAKKAAVAPIPSAKTIRDPIAPDEELALLREFARLFVSERVRVAYDPKDRDEWQALFSRVKAVLGSKP